jgi:acetate kinase
VILVFNVGSSSLKLCVYQQQADGIPDGGHADDLVLAAKLEIGGLGTANTTARGGRGTGFADLGGEVADRHDHRAALVFVWDWLQRQGLPTAAITAVSHRVVHGGANFSAPAVIDQPTRIALGKLAALAPLHMPPCLAVIDGAKDQIPEAVHIACFDTAFHATLPELARRLPLPEALHQLGYRRYGFHGLSYESAVAALPLRLGKLPQRLVVAHLGNGASATAIRDGRSVATTMGYSAVDGLVMGTRTGNLDPGVLLSLMRDHGLTPAALERLIYHESGLLALSGDTSDMRTLLASAAPRAAFAVDYYAYWAARQIGSLVVALGGIDALVFTGGIGEHAAPVRAAICTHLEFLGVSIDNDRNRANQPTLSAAEAAVAVLIEPANEELVMARHARHALKHAQSAAEFDAVAVSVQW